MAVPMPRPWWSGSTAAYAALAVADVGVPDQPVAVEDADRAGREVEPRLLPVADDLVDRDLGLAEVDDLLGGDHLDDRRRVVQGQARGWSGRRAGRSRRSRGRLHVDRAADPGRGDVHADLLVEAERAGARVGRELRAAPRRARRPTANASTSRAWARPRPRWSLRVASRAMYAQSAFVWTSAVGDHLAGRVGDHAEVPRLEARAARSCWACHSSNVSRSRTDHSRKASS